MRWLPWFHACIVLVLIVHDVTCHLCLLTPKQRGPLSIKQGGDPTCFRHELPCGGQPIEDPGVTYAPGQTAIFKWQQNYNHYEPGYPGYLDLAIAPTADSTNFTTLFVVSDKYVHAQDHQHNYTAIVKLPDTECDHCVIRVRYNAHKPGETTFLQCSDIKISSKATQKSTTLKFSSYDTPQERRQLQPLKRAIRLRNMANKKNGMAKAKDDSKLYGFAYNPFQVGTSQYISVGASSGQIQSITSYAFAIDSPASDGQSGGGNQKFLLDEVISIDNTRNTSYVLIHDGGSRDNAAKSLYNIGSTNGSVFQTSNVFQFTGGAINALSWYTFGVSAAFRIQPTATAGTYTFEAGQLNFGGTYRKMAEIPKPENLYVNFQWLETSVDNYHNVYALMGNENAPNELNARIYVFDIFDGKFVRWIELDVSQYTFMSMHSYPKAGDVMYAFSPGLWSAMGHAWSLVAVDTVTGNVTKRCTIAPAGIFERYYGGSVYQGSGNEDGLLYHVLRVQGSEADVVVSVNPDSCQLHFSDFTNLRHVHSLQKLAQP